MKIDRHIPELVQPIIKDYIRLIEQRLVGPINASYVMGPIGLCEVNEYVSDVDFITVLSRRASPIDLGHLREIHQSIERTYPRWKMSGSYVQASDLRKRGDTLRPYPQFHDGVLYPVIHDAINSVTTYWRSWTRHPGRVVVLYSNWGIQWAVLGVLRQFFTFREKSITTKVKAGEYALDCLPRRWHPLIEEAINIRHGQKGSVYRSRFGRMVQTVRFLNYVIDTCYGHFIS